MSKEMLYDLKGQSINIKGYRIDTDFGNIIHNTDGSKMFAFESLDEEGGLPAPFSIERFNFNPF